MLSFVASKTRMFVARTHLWEPAWVQLRIAFIVGIKPSESN